MNFMHFLILIQKIFFRIDLSSLKKLNILLQIYCYKMLLYCIKQEQNNIWYIKLLLRKWN